MREKHKNAFVVSSIYLTRSSLGVSWGRAFRGAIMIVIYSVVWLIIGGVLIAFGYSMSVASSVSSILSGIGGSSFNQNYSAAGQYGGLVLVIVGIVIIMVGTYASVLKVQTDIFADEIEKRLKSAPPSS